MKKIQNLIEIIARTILKFLYKIVGKTMTETQWESWRQFIGFVEVGITNFLVNYITYAFFLYIGFSYHMANIMGFIISVFNAFYWNNKICFQAGRAWKEKLAADIDKDVYFLCIYRFVTYRNFTLYGNKCSWIATDCRTYNKLVYYYTF